MSDTPTFANLLTQWTSGDPAARAGVYVHLRNDPTAAEVLGHYPDQMRVVWPALVALLVGNDERAVLLAVPSFRPAPAKRPADCVPDTECILPTDSEVP